VVYLWGIDKDVVQSVKRDGQENQCKNGVKNKGAKMNLTNKYNIPEIIYLAVKDQIYKPDPKLLRVSELISPPLQKRLTLKYWDKIERDASEFIKPLIGTGGHLALEAVKLPDDTHRELTLCVKIPGTDVMLKGTTDYYDTNKRDLQDHKFASLFALIFGAQDGYKKYTEQMNCYAWMLANQTCYKDVEFPYPDSAQINLTMTDWSQREAMQKGAKDYPQTQSVAIPIELWGEEKAQKFINERVKLHLSEEVFECTPDEKWERPTTYAVMKKGRKSALAATNPLTKEKITSPLEAEKVISIKKLEADYEKGTVYIEKRPGERINCERFCFARDFCPYNKLTGKKDGRVIKSSGKAYPNG